MMLTSKEELIETHLGLAQSLAQQVWRSAPHALELDEMRAIANFGLVDAADRWLPYCEKRDFDPNRLEYFKPFVVRRVRGALIDAIRASDWATRSLRTRAKQLQDASSGKVLSYSELARRTGMTEAEVRSTERGMSRRPVSLEAEELELGSEQDVESSVFTQMMLTRVVSTIQRLDADQQVVLALHYFHGMQLQAVAAEMGVSESKASQLHASAVLAVHREMLLAAKQAEGRGKHVSYWQTFQRECYDTAKKSGFHDNDSDEPELGGLQHARRLMLIVCEVTEAFEELRKGADVTEVWFEEGDGAVKKPEGVPVELADVVIRIGDFCEAAGIDLGAAIEAKMAFNKTRERLHGKAF